MTNAAQKHGRPNENTPTKWNAEYTDYGPPAPTDEASATSSKPAQAAPRSEDAMEASASEQLIVEAMQSDAGAHEDKKDRKRKHEGETAEERAERKRKKKERKEAKGAKKTAE
jgi:H/ACA ribonucleoprotein complex subunit 4